MIVYAVCAEQTIDTGVQNALHVIILQNNCSIRNEEKLRSVPVLKHPTSTTIMHSVWTANDAKTCIQDTHLEWIMEVSLIFTE